MTYKIISHLECFSHFLFSRCEILDHDINKTFTVLNHSTLQQYIPRLASGKFDSCSLLNTSTNISYRCDSWVYDPTYYQSSRAIEWEFVCDKRWMGAVAQSMYMFGVFIGAVFLGNMADKVGRKPVFCWSAILQLIFGVGVAFTPEYFSFLIIRFLYGIFGSAGSYIPGKYQQLNEKLKFTHLRLPLTFLRTTILRC